MTTASATEPPASGTMGPRLWGLLFVLSGNMLIDALEVSVVIVAMPSIGDDLHLPLSALQWLISGFALGFGGLLLFGGRVVNRLGRRRTYLAALLVFAVASLVGGLTSAGVLLIATRFVKGFCVALTAPTGLSIISSTFPEGAARNRAVSIYSLFGASGFSAGLLLSGLLTPLSWRWTFLFPAPVALALLLFGLRLIPGGDPGEDTGRRYDVAGAAASLAAMLVLVYAIVTVPEAGWFSGHTLGALTLAALLFTAFVLIERSTAQPLVRPGVLTGRLLRSAVGAAALNGSYWGFLLVITFQLQSLPGGTPLWTGLVMLPGSMLLMLAAPFSGRMVSRVGAARLIAFGAAAPPAGYILYWRSGIPPVDAGDVVPTMLLVGLGFALCFAALHVQAITGVPPSDRAMVSGVYQTAVQIGGALMISLVTVLSAGRNPWSAAGHRPALTLIICVGVLGFLVAMTGVLPRRRTARA